jgi:hypothetical protein
VPVFTGQEIKPQARVLAVDHGLCGLRGVTLNNDQMRYVAGDQAFMSAGSATSAGLRTRLMAHDHGLSTGLIR